MDNVWISKQEADAWKKLDQQWMEELAHRIWLPKVDGLGTPLIVGTKGEIDTSLAEEMFLNKQTK